MHTKASEHDLDVQVVINLLVEAQIVALEVGALIAAPRLEQ